MLDALGGGDQWWLVGQEVTEEERVLAVATALITAQRATAVDPQRQAREEAALARASVRIADRRRRSDRDATAGPSSAPGFMPGMPLMQAEEEDEDLDAEGLAQEATQLAQS